VAHTQRRIEHTISSLCAASLCLALVGCGGGGGGAPQGPDTVDGSARVTAAAGGTVTLASGPTLQVPAAAVAADTTITIEQTGDTAPGGAPVFRFLPAGTTFANAATVTFPNPQGLSSATVYWSEPGSATAFTALPATVTADGIVAQVTHFSVGFVGAACAEGAACAPSNPCHAGTISCAGGAPASS
jgi:hypothetical protein